MASRHWLRFALLLLAVAATGCSVHVRYERGGLAKKKVVKTWETDRTAEVRIGPASEGTDGFRIDCTGSKRVHKRYELKFHKIDVRETYTPFLEIIEFPLAIIGPVLTGAVVVPTWLVSTPFYAFYLHGCLDGDLFSAWKQVGEDWFEYDNDDFAFGDFIQSILLDAIGVGIVTTFVPTLICAGVDIGEELLSWDVLLWFPNLVFGDDAGKVLNPLRNYFSWEFKDETGEFYTTHTQDHQDVRGPLAGLPVDVTILGRRLQLKSDGDGRCALTGRGRSSALVRGLRGGTPIPIEARIPGYRLDKGGAWSVPPSHFFAALAVLEGSDWTAGSAPSRGRPTLTASASRGSGARAVLRMTLRNQNKVPLHRLRVMIHSRTRECDDWHATFGRLAPGQQAVRTVEMSLPRDEASLSHTVLVEVLDGRGRRLLLKEVTIPAR